MYTLVKYALRMFFIVLWIAVIYLFLMVPAFFGSKKEEKSLRIYTWANRIDEDVIRQFEQDTGIKIYLNYYESSEELLTKVEKTSSIDFDIMIPSGYMIEKMIQKNLLKKIEKDKCPYIKSIYPEFLNLYFDKENNYSIPIFWDVFGIGYNEKFVGDTEVTLKMLFEKDHIVGNEIGMTDDARESIFLAAQYLNISVDKHLTSDDMKQIHDLLLKQRNWVGSYSDSQQGYFLSSDTFAVVASDREIVARQMLKHSNIKFALIPQGSMMRLDNIVIHAATKKEAYVYKFLDYLFSYTIMMHHVKKYSILPTMKNVFTDLDEQYIGVPELYPGSASFKKLVVFNHGLTQKALNDFWIQFKAS